jgi:DNA-binding NarL/FixJ family response regulator
VIRILIVDDHPAVRRGLVSALRSEPGLVSIGVAEGMAAALAEAERSTPDVALVDYQLADGDGLILCHRLKLFPGAPRVVIYSAFARRGLALAAMVAGADGMVNKGAPLDELFGAIRTVARGGRTLPVLRPGALERRVAQLEPEDLPILGMRMDGATLAEIASVLQVGERELSRRLTAMLGRLAAPPAPGRRRERTDDGPAP